MKVILTQEVDGWGEPGDLVTVKPGFARNYLFPRGLATAWTKGGQKQVDSIRRARKVREVADLDEAHAIRGRLESGVVRVKVRAGKDGRIFGSVTPTIIAEAIKDANMGDIDKRKIEVRDIIKSTGQTVIKVRLHPEVSARVKIDVVGS